ncbi:MAG: hypothetical protein B6D68_00765 [spirochete symbiont of Stewartia floridana]|nr:MAG: hypothetical protein B6D68_00765 [spirochete symbiont of Stewartia floridana]
MRTMEELAAGIIYWFSLLGIMLLIAVFILDAMGMPVSSVSMAESIELQQSSPHDARKGSIVFDIHSVKPTMIALAFLSCIAAVTLISLAIVFMLKKDYFSFIFALGIVLVHIAAALGIV